MHREFQAWTNDKTHQFTSSFDFSCPIRAEVLIYLVAGHYERRSFASIALVLSLLMHSQSSPWRKKMTRVRSTCLLAFLCLAGPLHLSAGLVTRYDATALTGLSNGDAVTTWYDISGNGNDALVAAGATGVGVLETNGVGGLQSVRFVEGQGYDSRYKMGTKFGIQGDASWTMMAVFRLDVAFGYDEIVALGDGNDRYSRSMAGMEIDSGRLDVAGAWSNDVILAGSPSPSFNPFLKVDVIVTITNERGIGNGSMLATTKLWVNGWAPGEAGGPLENNFLSTTGGAFRTPFNIYDRKLHIGRSGPPSLNGFTGLVSEILIYNTALSDTDRRQVEGQLIQKYSIQNANSSAIPEPSTMATFGIGFLLILGTTFLRRRRTKNLASRIIG